MNFRPLHDRVVVRRIEGGEDQGGIIIPDTPRRSPRRARSRGRPGPRRERQGRSLDVKAGDRVLFGKWSGTEVKIDGQDLLIMKESDIMGVRQTPWAKKAA
jgi:chaperonin GroES